MRRGPADDLAHAVREWIAACDEHAGAEPRDWRQAVLVGALALGSTSIAVLGLRWLWHWLWG